MPPITDDGAYSSDDRETTLRLIQAHKRGVADLRRILVHSRDLIRESRELIARSAKQLARPAPFGPSRKV